MTTPDSKVYLQILLMLFFAALSSFAQKPDSPGKIRGYKVQKADVLVLAAQENVPVGVETNFDSLVKIGKPQNFSVVMAGAAFDVPLSVNIFKTGGRIDQIVFEEPRLAGIKMQVEDFAHSFEFTKGIETVLPSPLKVKIDMTNNLKALTGLDPTSKTFQVTGRVLIFGTFKKFGFKFKRVIPLDLKFEVKVSLAELLN